jgi:hypothetical protein
MGPPRDPPPRRWTHPEEYEGGRAGAGDGIDPDTDANDDDDDDDDDDDESNRAGQEEGDEDDSDASTDDTPLSQFVAVAGGLEALMEGEEEAPPEDDDETPPNIEAQISMPPLPDGTVLRIHKTTAMAHLASGERVSADRQHRYIQISKSNLQGTEAEHIDLHNEAWIVGLGSNVAVLCKSKGSTKKTVHAGRITHIRVKARGGRWKEHTKNINLTAMRDSTESKKETVHIQCHYYTHTSGNTRTFLYDTADPTEVTPSII